MIESYSFKKDNNSSNGNTSYESKKSIKMKERKSSINSANSDSSFNILNSEIKSIIENETDLSFSNISNSDSDETKQNIECLFESKYWRANKETSLETILNSTNESQNEKYILPKDTKTFHSKYIEDQEIEGINVKSNKQSTQSNEDEEIKTDHSYNSSNSETNNNSPLNSLENLESEKKIKINMEEDKNQNIKDKNVINNNTLYMNRYNNLQNLKYNSEYCLHYDSMNCYNNVIPFFPGNYLPQQMYSFIPNYNYSNINNKIFLLNQSNNQIETKNTSLKKDNQSINPYINNMNAISKSTDMNNNNLPLVLNQINSQNKLITNFNFPKINYNMIYCPQIQQTNNAIQKPLNKANNSSNYLPEINNKENALNINNKNIINNSSNNSPVNTNICPLIDQNNKIKNNNKMLNNKNLKGEKQVLNLDDIATGKDTRTTVMIRNIPIKYTDEILIEALKEFKGKYDCLYMPFDYEKNGNKGYAFINFVNPLHILYFYEKFNGQKWLHFESSKICELNCAHFQGINEIQKHAKNYKGQKKPNYYSKSENNENIIIPSKYLLKLIKRFPKMKYTENKSKKIVIVKSFE